MAAVLQVLEGGAGVGEREDAVDDGLEVVGSDGGVHAGEHGSAADVDTVEVNGFGEDGADVDSRACVGAGAGEHADDVDVAGGANCRERFGDGALAADFDDMVDAEVVGEVFRGLVPVGVGFVVDDVRGAEAAGAFELLVGRAGEDDGGAVHAGDLQGEEGDTAGALDEDGLAGVEVALLDERVPGGERGAGEGGGFLEAEMCGRVDEAGFGEDAFGGEDAVDGAAERGFAGERLDLAVEPVLKEERADAVAGLEESDGRADGDDLAGCVGAEDAGELHLGVVVAERNHEVAVVERGAAEADVDVGGAERGEFGGFEREIRNVVQAEGVEAKRGRHVDWMRQREAESRGMGRVDGNKSLYTLHCKV